MFGGKLVDDLVAEWQFENYAWLIQNFSLGAGHIDFELWLPIADHFAIQTSTGHSYSGRKLAKTLFDRIAQQCGFGHDHGINLKASLEQKDQQVGETTFVRSLGDTACGRYVREPLPNGEVSETIYYDSDLASDPNGMIATLAHELSHALHHRAPQDHTELDPELYELFTDLTAIFLGYGVFIANSRFEFSAFQDATTFGWQAKGAGYLPEADIVFALAIFMAIKDIPPQIALPHLKPRLGKMLNKAQKQLRRYGSEIEALKGLVPISRSP